MLNVGNAARKKPQNDKSHRKATDKGNAWIPRRILVLHSLGIHIVFNKCFNLFLDSRGVSFIISSEMVYFVKELAEFYLLFSGAILLIGAKAYTADFWPDRVSSFCRFCHDAFVFLILRRRVFRKLIEDFKLINSFIRTRLEKALQ